MAGSNTSLGTAWISVTADTKSIAPEISKALGGAEKSAESAGGGIGSRLSTGIGKTLKAGALATGAVVGGTLATSIAKGMGRLNSIDQATAKLEALGNSGESVDTIMDNALASVKGTAFGIGEAAGTAATMVASGIEPGERLETTLKGVADSAAIAGVGMDDMGLIWGKVAAKGKLDGEVVAQMLERQIPIYDILSQKTGVAAEDIADMVSKGEIDFQTFSDAMNEYVGGGAVRMGQTVGGAMDNVGAALGRFGATLAAPVFGATPELLQSFTTVFDEMNTAIKPAAERIGQSLTPALESLAGLVEDRLAPAMADGAGKLGDLVASFVEAAVDPENWERFGDVFEGMKGTFERLGPSLESLAGSFLVITKNVSVATWQALGDVLNALTPLIETVLVPLVEQIAKFAKQNPGAVQGMVMAFLGFKAVGMIAGPVGQAAGALRTLGSAGKFFKTAFAGKGLAAGLLQVGEGAKSANPLISKAGKGVGVFTKVLATAGRFVSPFARVLGFLVTKINPIVAAISLVVGALVWFFTKTELGQRLWGDFTDALGRGWDAIVEKFTAGVEWLKGAFDGIKELFTGGDFASAFADSFGIDENSPIITGIARVRELFTDLKDFITGVGDVLFKGDFTGLPFGLEEDSGFVNFLFTLRDAFISTGDTIKAVFNGIWQVIQVTLGVIGTIILAPLILAWNLLSMVIQSAWTNIIQPVFGMLGEAGMWIWDNGLKPAIDGIVAGWTWLKDTLYAGWIIVKTLVFDAFIVAAQWLQSVWTMVTTALSLAWQSVLNFFLPIWTSIKTSVFDAFSWAAGVLQSVWNAVTGALNAAWQSVLNFFLPIWNSIRDSVFTAWNIAVEYLRGVFESVTNALSVAWTWLKDQMFSVWTWIDSNVLGGFRSGMEALKGFFSGVVEGIKSAWESLRSALAGPINFMIRTVYGSGIKPAWNTIAGFLPGLKDAPNVASIPAFATGGRISGRGTGTSDDVLMWGSNGEHMLTAEDVDLMGGHHAVYAMRAALEMGRAFTYDGHGGLAVLPFTDNRVGDLAGAAPDLLIPGFKDGGEIRPMWEIQLENGHRAAKMRNGNPYTWGNEDCSGYMSMIADAIVNGGNGVRRWATGSFPGGQPFVPGLGAGFSVGVHDNPGGPGGGHTAGTLTGVGPYSTVNVESGGSHGHVAYGGPAVGADSAQWVGRSPGQFHLAIGADGAFESGGGGGGPSPEQMMAKIREKIESTIDKFMSPIVGQLPSKPPEWQGIPKGIYDKGKKGMLDAAFGAAEALGDKLRTAYAAVKKLGDLTTAVAGNVNDLARRSWNAVFDTGGVLPAGGTAQNKSGKPELILNAAQWKIFNAAVAAMPHLSETLYIAALELQEAHGGGDWGYGALSELAGGNEDLANALVTAARVLGEFERSYVADVLPVMEKSGTEYAKTQGTAVLDYWGLGGLIGIGESLYSKWESAQDAGNKPGVAPVEPVVSIDPVGVAPTPVAQEQGSPVVVELTADSDNETITVGEFKELAARVDGLEVQTNKRPKAAAVTGGGVM